MLKKRGVWGDRLEGSTWDHFLARGSPGDGGKVLVGGN